MYGLPPGHYTYSYTYVVPASRSVSDSALKRACYVVRFAFADRYDVRNGYYKNYGRVALMGVNEVTTHIPEHRSGTGIFFLKISHVYLSFYLKESTGNTRKVNQSSLYFRQFL